MPLPIRPRAGPSIVKKDSSWPVTGRHRVGGWLTPAALPHHSMPRGILSSDVPRVSASRSTGLCATGERAQVAATPAVGRRSSAKVADGRGCRGSRSKRPSVLTVHADPLLYRKGVKTVRIEFRNSGRALMRREKPKLRPDVGPRYVPSTTSSRGLHSSSRLDRAASRRSDSSPGERILSDLER